MENEMLDLMNTNDWDFPVEMEPCLDMRGNEIPKLRNLIRSDTGESLGTHKSKYKMITHSDAVNSIMDSIQESKISTDYEVKSHTADNGAKMRLEVLFNDIKLKDPEVNSYIQYRVQAYNSYDGSWAFQQSAEGIRLWCLNGCTTPDTVAKTWAKHTTNVSVDSSAQKITDGVEMFLNNKGVWEAYRSTPVTNEQVEHLFKKTVCNVQHRASHDKFNDRQLQNLMGTWDNERSQLGNNQWALYNCLTSWATHTEDAKSPENAKRQRESAIIKAMKHKAWLELA
jgi:hypothetical protein|tara:strand:+ start:918 stop:1766 length:849 start_codon:yes stop_codon:yes gene_type:complete